VSEPLKACPFCGGAGTIETWGPTGAAYVWCEVCRAEVGGDEQTTESVAMWNRRAMPAEVRKVVERMVQEREGCLDCQYPDDPFTKTMAAYLGEVIAALEAAYDR